MIIRAGAEQDFAEFMRVNMKNDVFANFYARTVIEFMEAWADEMEKMMEDGYSVDKVARDALKKACSQVSLSWAQYAFARNYLFDYWAHGEELKEAKNKGIIE